MYTYVTKVQLNPIYISATFQLRWYPLCPTRTSPPIEASHSRPSCQQSTELWRPLGPSFVDAHKFSRSFIFGDCRPILETFGDLKSTFFIYFNMNNQQCSPLCFTLQHSSILQGNLLTRLLESLTLTTRLLLGTIMSTFGLPSRRNGPPLLYWKLKMG